MWRIYKEPRTHRQTYNLKPECSFLSTNHSDWGLLPVCGDGGPCVPDRGIPDCEERPAGGSTGPGRRRGQLAGGGSGFCPRGSGRWGVPPCSLSPASQQELATHVCITTYISFPPNNCAFLDLYNSLSSFLLLASKACLPSFLNVSINTYWLVPYIL